MSKSTHVHETAALSDHFKTAALWDTLCIYLLSYFTSSCEGSSCCMTVYCVYSVDYSTPTNCNMRTEHVSVRTPVSMAAHAMEDMQLAVRMELF